MNCLLFRLRGGGGNDQTSDRSRVERLLTSAYFESGAAFGDNVIEAALAWRGVSYPQGVLQWHTGPPSKRPMDVSRDIGLDADGTDS